MAEIQPCLKSSELKTGLEFWLKFPVGKPPPSPFKQSLDTVIVGMLSYVIMPPVTRVLSRWLYV